MRSRPATPRATSDDRAERVRKVQTLVAKGQRSIDEGRPDQAIVEFLEADLLDPRNAVVQNNLCVANTLLRRYDDAIGTCKAALNLEPDFELAKNNLAWALSERAKSEASTPR
jgi:tetratricopeptide (TPR) repeat protein